VRLAEAYIHVKISETIRFDALAERLQGDVVSLTREIFVRDIKLEFLLEEGTILERAKVIGKPIAVVLGLVAGYHELRESVIDLYNDAKHFSELVIKDFHKNTHTSPSAVIYQRKLPSDVNRLYRIIQSADRLSDEIANDPLRRSETERVISDLAGLWWSNPDDGGSQMVLDNLPKKNIPGLPNTIKAVVDLDARRRKTTVRLAPEVGKGVPSGRPRRRRYERTITL
jgi:hypothetical protein